jgi:Flp pilus assembly protein TadD
MMLFQRLTIMIASLLLSVACQSDTSDSSKISQGSLGSQGAMYSKIAKEVGLPKSGDAGLEKITVDHSETSPEIRQQTEYMYLALTAELYNRLDVSEKSAKNYQELVSQTDDAAIAKRATILAATNDESKNALLNAQKWVRLQATNLEANQYLALLLLRNNKQKESAVQLRRIEQLVLGSETKAEKDSFKSLRFIGALLSVESHHQKALNVFKEYITQTSLKDVNDQGLQVQQQLILASLANQANSYDEVISSLKQLDRYVTEEKIEPKSFIKASLMKAKALKKVKRVSDAVDILKPVVDEYDASDSVTLELVRLLIMDEQKQAAFTYLKGLTIKHPQNKDLLKSLIALEIDQANYQSATKNIQKLKSSADYKSDAEYFMAEIFEAQGDKKSALEKYQNVTDGTLMKNARKKVARLSKQLAREEKPQAVNFRKN